VVLHSKSIPWFVLDALPSDLDALLAALVVAPRERYETPTEEEKGQRLEPEKPPAEELEDLEFVFEEWSRFRAEGKLVLRPDTDRVWTGPGCFWRLCAEAGPVVEDLSGGHLAIFKGDLNYRKLVGDVSTYLLETFLRFPRPLLLFSS
jgi:damage-control phosphatase, subfamily III